MKKSVVLFLFSLLMFVLLLTACDTQDSQGPLGPQGEQSVQGETLAEGYYSITYSNLQGAPAPELTQYASHIGVADTEMPVLTRDGYEFLGWYTEIENGVRVFDIKVGSTGNYHLYARWKQIEYEIVYIDAPITNNPSTYTGEQTIVLSNPQWTGLSFAYWTDSNGEIITKIPKGTTGDIELTAHWRSVKNLAIPNQDNEFDVLYDEKNEQYYFIYKLGTIQNVVLDQLYSYKYDGTSHFTYTLNETVSVGESAAHTVAQTIVKSITQTEGWSHATETVEQHSTSVSAGCTLSPTIEYMGIKASVYEASIGYNELDFDSYTESEKQEYFYANDATTSNTVSAVVSYVKDTTTTVEKNISLNPSNSRAGLYSYVQAGDLYVYAIVTYNPSTANYYLDTYSMVYRVFETTIYDLVPEFNLGVHIESNDAFTFDVPVDQMKAYVDSAYYVKYDPNGGTGTMPMSTLAYDKEQTLPNNTFKKDGHSFAGWKLAGEGALILDGAVVKNLAERGQAITLVADWVKLHSNVVLDLNSSSIKKTPVALTTNTSKIFYATDGSLPKPEAQYYLFDGWFTDPVGGTRVTDEKGEYTNWAILGDITLYAHWKHERGYENYTYLSANEFSKIQENPSGWYMLIEDVPLSDFSYVENFSGILDGRGNKLYGWRYIQNSIGNIGLFQNNNGTITNLLLDDFRITTSDPNVNGLLNAGLLCGVNNGTISNVNVTNGYISVDVGSISNDNNNYVRVGALCGENKGNITSCKVLHSTLHGYAGTQYQGSQVMVGGAVGYSTGGTISDVESKYNVITCIAKADTKGKNIVGKCKGHGRPRAYAAGIIGLAESTSLNLADSMSNNYTIDATASRDCSCDTNIGEYEKNINN